MPTPGLVRAMAAAALAALVAACTSASPEPDPTPSPSPSETEPVAVEQDTGARITVIVPPDSVVAAAEAAALLHAADELAATPPDGVSAVGVVQATSEAFVRDLANLAVDDGRDLVCVVGTGSAELVLELARARRDGRFCTTDGRIAGGPVNVVSVGLDPAALVEAGAVAIGTAPAPVGLLLSPQLGEAEALTAAFSSTVAPPQQPTPSPEPSPTSSPDASDASGAASTSGDTTSSAATTATPSPDPSPSPSPAVPGPSSPQPPFVTITAGAGSAAQVSAGEQLAAQRPTRALVLATPGGAAAATAAAAGGTELVVVSDWAVDQQGEAPPNLLVALTVDWGALLRAAVEAGRTPDAPQVQLAGVADGILGAIPGQVEEAVAAAERTTEHLRRSTE